MTNPTLPPTPAPVKVMLAGLGHAGTKAALIAARQFPSPGYRFIAVDTATELDSLQDDALDQVILMTENWESRIPDLIQGLEMLVIILGLGGKTAPEAARSLLKAAELLNVPVAVIATTPFSFEGDQHRLAATKAYSTLKSAANAVILLPNDLLLGQFPQNYDAVFAYEQADSWIAEVAVSLLKPFTFTNVINVRREKLEWLLKRKNASCAVAIGWGDGDDAITDAVSQIENSPFLQQQLEHGQADAALVIVTFPEGSTLEQVHGCLNALKRHFAPQLELEIGACIDDSVSEEIRIVTLMRFPATRQKNAAETAANHPDENDADTHAAADSRGLTPPETSISDYTTGIFNRNSPTAYRYENLDVPTYIRKHIPIDL